MKAHLPQIYNKLDMTIIYLLGLLSGFMIGGMTYAIFW